MGKITKMADEKKLLVLKITIVHDSKKHPLEFQFNPGCEPTVADLSTKIACTVGVPEDGQKLIYKGKSLQVKDLTLQSLGIKNGAKIMLIGKVFNEEEDQKFKLILGVEKKTNKCEEKLQELSTELDHLVKGFAPPHLLTDQYKSLLKRFKGAGEELMRLLESLDGIHNIDESFKQIKGKKKSLSNRIQALMDKVEANQEQIETTLKESSAAS